MQALANEVIRVRINEQLKHEANEVLESIGLTMSCHPYFLKRVVDEKALPFVLKMPRHLDASQMSKEEFDSRMERSFRDIEEGRVLSMEEVLRNSKKEQVNDFQH